MERTICGIKSLLLLVLLMVAAGAQAQDANKLFVPDFTGTENANISVSINLSNTNPDIVALQFDLVVPHDVMVLADNGASLTDRKADHQVVLRAQGQGRYRVMAYSPSNQPFKGNSGQLLGISATTAAQIDHSGVFPIKLENVVLSDSKGNNVAMPSADGTFRIKPSPDFEVSGVSVAQSAAMPGDTIDVSWTVKNVGSLASSGGWSERVALVSADGNEKSLGTFYGGAQSLGIGSAVSRSIKTVLPALLGLDGEAKIRVEVVPNSDSGEETAFQNNNTAETAGNALNVGKRLVLGLPAAAVDENTSAAVRCQLSRSGNNSIIQTFALKKTAGDGRLALPGNVSIPAGQSGVFFYATLAGNDQLDADSLFTFEASGNGYEAVSATMSVADDELPSLNIKASKSEITEGSAFQLTVSIPKASAKPTAVGIVSEQPKRFSHPATATIPAGETSATVEVEAVDNADVELQQSVAFKASAERYMPAECIVLLDDNDIPAIDLSLSPSSVSESAGPNAIIATVRRTTNADKAVTIQLSDDSDGGIYYPQKSVFLDKGVEEAQLSIGVIDNSKVDTSRVVNITAAVYISSCSCSASGSSAGVVSKPVEIIDDDGPALSVAASQPTLLEGSGEGIVLAIKRNANMSSALTVNISSDRDEALSYGHSATIPAGAESVEVQVKALPNAAQGDDKPVVFTVEAADFAKATCWVMLTDQTLPDARVKAIAISKQNAEVGGEAEVSVTIENLGAADLPEATKTSIYFSGSSLPMAYLYTADAIPAGGSATVSKTVTLPKAVGAYEMYAVANDGRAVKELVYANNTSDKVPLTIVSPFKATVSVGKKIYNQGDSILITGRLEGSKAANEEVEVYVVNGGYRHAMSVTADENGNFKASYLPYPAQMGHFAVGACYPGEKLDSEMSAFDIYGLKRVSNAAATCETLVGEAYNGTLALSNPGTLPLSGVKATVLSKPSNCAVEAVCPATVGAGATFSLSYKLTGSAASQGDDWEQVRLLVETSEGASLPITLYYYCRSPKGQLKASVEAINTTMVKGASRDYPFQITNIGKGETGKISIATSSAEWLGLATPAEISSLAFGESATVVLRFTPTSDLQLNVPLKADIAVNCQNGDGIVVHAVVEPVSEMKGNLKVKVSDEYTYYTKEKPYVSGAGVTVKHPTTGAIIAQGVTDASGQFTVELPEGYYTINVTEKSHSSYTNNVLVDPGRDTNHDVFLNFQSITYSWDVVPTEIEDEYAIKTNVEYETRVPAPVVVVDFPEEIPYRDGIVNVVVTNKGLIPAHNIEVNLPEADGFMKLEALVQLPIEELRPQESVAIPILVSVDVDDAVPSHDAVVAPIDPNAQPEASAPKAQQASAEESEGGGCHRVQVDVSRDEEECDKNTGTMKPTGRKVTVSASYPYGDCTPGWKPGAHVTESPSLPYFPSTPNAPGTPSGKPGNGNKTTEADTYAADRLRTILLTGCTNKCEDAVGETLGNCLNAIPSCMKIKDVMDAVRGKKGDDLLESMFKDLDEDATELPAYVGCVMETLGNCVQVGASSYDYGDCFFGATKGCLNELKIPFIDNPFSDENKEKENWEKVRDELIDAGSLIPGPVGFVFSCGKAISECVNSGIDAVDKCREIKNAGKAEVSVKRNAKEISADNGLKELRLLTNSFDYIYKGVAEIFKSPEWQSVTVKEYEPFVDEFTSRIDPSTGLVSKAGDLYKFKPQGVSGKEFESLFDRWNNGVKRSAGVAVEGDYINMDSLALFTAKLEEYNEEVAQLGYKDFREMSDNIVSFFHEQLEKAKDPSSSVCSSISLQLSQTMAMTRQAFRGTLTVFNGNEEKPMKDVKLTLDVRGKDGNIATSHEFQINAEKLEGFVGQPSLDAGWTLDAGKTGTATVLFIPTKYAALETGKDYSFGGTLSYIDPFTGLEVVRDLYPVTLTVKPSPILDLDYFMQRDIYGDDALTTDVVEPSEPAEFALVINNKGYSDADNVRMETQQPKIVDNEKGLLIDFELLSSQLNGKDHTLALGQSVATDFGTIPARSTAYAQWWLQSSLLGHFTDYDVEATHVTSYGNEDLSLLDNVEIHELVHGFTARQDADTLVRAFLVNDIVDAADQPDMVYFSDGSPEQSVAAASAVRMERISDTQYAVTVEPSAQGWNYGSTSDLTAGRQRLASVSRKSDGASLPADNAWLTSRTLRDGKDPLNEFRLHIAARLDAEETFVLTFEPKPDVQLQVESFEGVPTDGGVLTSQLRTLSVAFNKDVDASTFTPADLQLSCQGKAVDVSQAKISRAGGSKFAIDLGDATLQNGYYVLTVQAAGITDAEGFSGAAGKSASWTQYADGTVALLVKAQPAEGGTVSPTSGRVEYGSEVELKATPAEGYDFAGWQRGGEAFASEPSFAHVMSADEEFTALFALKHFNVEILYDPAFGTVRNAATGIYGYGTVLEMDAVPNEGYKFDGWMADPDTLSVAPAYRLTVDSDIAIAAQFSIDEATGIGSAEGNGRGMTIAPLPLRGVMYVDGDFNAIRRLAVLDIHGSAWIVRTGLQRGAAVGVSMLPKGIYIVKAVTDNGTFVKKVVKI